MTMKHYKFPGGDVCGYDDQRQQELIDQALASGALEMTESEFSAFQNPPVPEMLRRDQIMIRLAQIDLETIRPQRAILAETATQDDHDKLSLLEAEAISLREELSLQ